MGLTLCRSPAYTKRLSLEILNNNPSVEEKIISVKKGNWFRWLLKDCSTLDRTIPPSLVSSLNGLTGECISAGEHSST